MRISRRLLTGAAVGTILGTGRADLNATHVTNPKWPPHARFHGVAGWGTIAGSQLLGLWLLWRPGQKDHDRDLAVKTAAALSALAWLPFFAAVATPGARGRRRAGPFSAHPRRGSQRGRRDYADSIIAKHFERGHIGCGKGGRELFPPSSGRQSSGCSGGVRNWRRGPLTVVIGRWFGSRL